MKLFNIQTFRLLLVFTLSFLVGCDMGNKQLVSGENILDVKELTNKWNQANSTKNMTDLLSLYGDSVCFYGTKLNKQVCLDKKQSLFDKNPNFTQHLNGDIQVDTISDCSIKCSFIKQVSLGGEKKDYPSYLIFNQINGEWKIVVESDSITDKILRKKQIPEDGIKGDFDGDGNEEYMWLEIPTSNEDNEDCIEGCVSYIRFSNLKIPSIKIENCIGAQYFSNLNDLNKNGGDEIGFSPRWFTSCWSPFYVWTLKNYKWIYAIEPFSTHCQQWEEEIEPIEMDKENEGHVIIRFSEFINDYSDLVISTKSIEVIE